MTHKAASSASDVRVPTSASRAAAALQTATSLQDGQDTPASRRVVGRTGNEQGLAVVAKLQLLGRLRRVDGAEKKTGLLVVGVRFEAEIMGIFDSGLDKPANRGRGNRFGAEFRSHRLKNPSVVFETAGDADVHVFHAQAIAVNEKDGIRHAAAGYLTAQSDPAQTIVPQVCGNQAIDDRIVCCGRQNVPKDRRPLPT